MINEKHPQTDTKTAEHSEKHPVDILVEQAKPYIDIQDDTPYVILHDIYKFKTHLQYSGTSFCLDNNIFDQCKIRFTPEELHEARFSLNKGSAGPWLRISLKEKNGINHYFVAERFEDLQATLDFEIVLK